MGLYVIFLLLPALAYLGIGVRCAWFNHKDPLRVVLVTLCWPAIWGLGRFPK